jgi:hypothetical protein
MIGLGRRGASQSNAAREPATMDSPLPEIRQLSCLITLTLHSHQKESPTEDSSTDVCCRECHERWPCAEVCRACELFEVI